MFKSYEFLRYLGYDPKIKQNRYEYKIVDDDWEAVGIGVDGEVEIESEVGIAVIDTYSKKGLPVAPNLIRALQWFSQKYGYSLEELISLQKQYNPRYKDYEQDIERYLVLL